MQVSEVMHKGINTCQINDSIRQVAAIMKREDIGALPVYKNERPVGFVTDRDIVVSCVAQGHSGDDSISHAMTQEIFSIKEDADLAEAAEIMRQKQVSRLLVVDKGEQPVGMLSLRDITQNLDDEELKGQVISDIKH